jgi:hypothetical protein
MFMEPRGAVVGSALRERERVTHCSQVPVITHTHNTSVLSVGSTISTVHSAENSQV